jgi:hypothetical protein
VATREQGEKEKKEEKKQAVSTLRRENPLVSFPSSSPFFLPTMTAPGLRADVAGA